MWNPGDSVTLRGIYQGQVWYIQTLLVVQDTEEKTVLALLPGAECAAPRGYLTGKHGAAGHWERWEAYQAGQRALSPFQWQRTRCLFLLWPEVYYTIIHYWSAATDQFLCYYVNFQRPFQRTSQGFDTLDLELDLILQPDFTIEWKDQNEYQAGIRSGVILPEWAQTIEAAQREVLDWAERRADPFDGRWLNWHPDPAWTPPYLPADWEHVDGQSE